VNEPLFEEDVLPEREDGVHLRARRITPDSDDGARCRGAGVVVLTADASDTAAAMARIARPLGQAGYFVVALELARADDAAAAIEDLGAAVRTLKELARGRIGVVAVGAAAAVAVAAAGELPQLDAIVHAGGPLPAPARLARARAAFLVHRAGRGAANADADVQALIDRLRPAHARLTVRVHDADDGFVLRDAIEARIAWDQTRAFLDLELT
jgi:dienelactone hydrolase